MEKQNIVIVLGNTFLMDGVALTLCSKQDMRVVRLETIGPETVGQVKSLNPALIIFELYSQQPSIILSLLKEQASSVYIGLDLDVCQVVTLNSSRQFVRDMQELAWLAQSALDDEAPVWKGGRETEKLRNRPLK